jgi:hypothetical protein
MATIYTALKEQYVWTFVAGLSSILYVRVWYRCLVYEMHTKYLEYFSEEIEKIQQQSRLDQLYGRKFDNEDES